MKFWQIRSVRTELVVLKDGRRLASEHFHGRGQLRCM